jgi:hypothetical protein
LDIVSSIGRGVWRRVKTPTETHLFNTKLKVNWLQRCEPVWDQQSQFGMRQSLPVRINNKQVMFSGGDIALTPINLLQGYNNISG